LEELECGKINKRTREWTRERTRVRLNVLQFRGEKKSTQLMQETRGCNNDYQTSVGRFRFPSTMSEKEITKREKI